MKKRQIISIGLSLFLLGALNACDDKPEENKVGSRLAKPFL